MFILRSSKTHGTYSKPQLVKITSQSLGTAHFTPYCPYQMLNDYLELRPKYISDDEAFFVFRDRTPVKLSHMRDNLKQILRLAGFNAIGYNTHSLRAGRCLDLYNFGIQIPTLMKLGRWTSNAVYTYLSYDY